MAVVRGGPLRAVRIQIDLGQRIYQTPNTGSQGIPDGMRNDPRQCRTIAVPGRVRQRSWIRNRPQ
jgi:hypothetical protein